MKTRNDFVSNSSSCSFVINDVSAMIKLFKMLFNEVDIPWNFNNDITCRIQARRKDWENVYENINREKASFKPTFTDTSNDDDISYWDTIDTNFANIATSPEKLEGVVSVDFSCEDCGSGPIYLKMLYEFFERAGIKPDASKSEHDFLEDEERFYKILNGYGKNENTRTDRTA